MSKDTSMLRSLRTQLQEKQATAEGIAAEFKVDDAGNFEISTKQHKDYVGAVKDAEEIKSLLDAAESSAGHRDYLDAPEGKSMAGAHYGQPGPEAGIEVKSLADVFLNSDAYKAFQERGGVDGHRGPISLSGSVEGKSLYTLAAGEFSQPGLGMAQDLGLTEKARRKFHIRDLFPKSTTKANLLYGLRETGWTNNAAQVRERAASDAGDPLANPNDPFVFPPAPVSDLHMTTVTYPVAEIAHMIDAHKNILSDEGRLRSFINNRMVEGIRFAEDYDLLHSVGDGDKITGLFNVPGVQEYDPGAGTADKHDVQVRRAITKALLAEYEPTGLVLSPTMFEAIEVEEGSDGHLRVAVSVAIGAEKKVWRLNVVETTAMSDANYLLGAFGMGAELHDREAVSIVASTEHSDNMARGVVTFRADERLALEVGRPESFIKGVWQTPA